MNVDNITVGQFVIHKRYEGNTQVFELIAQVVAITEDKKLIIFTGAKFEIVEAAAFEPIHVYRR